MSNSCKKSEVYNGIDAFKAIAAILIVLLHAIETTDYFAGGVKFVFTRFAVPFFFITSGFFFSRGLHRAEDPSRYFRNYEKNLLKIFFVWGILIYGPFTITSYVTANRGAGILKIFALLVRRMLVIGSGPYWYLVALVCSTAVIYWCHSKKKEGFLVAGIIVGLLLEVAYSCFQGVLSQIAIFRWFFKVIYAVYSWEFNFLMFGIPFAGIGYFIYKKNVHISSKISACIFFLATLLRIVEYRLPVLFSDVQFWRENEISVVFIIQAISFFCLAKELNFKITKKCSLTLRQWSSCVYFSHAIILYNLLNPILEKLTEWPIYAPNFIAIKVVIVLMFCTLLFGIIKKINNKYLNILING